VTVLRSVAESVCVPLVVCVESAKAVESVVSTSCRLKAPVSSLPLLSSVVVPLA
jgi:hypothetical protein